MNAEEKRAYQDRHMRIDRIAREMQECIDEFRLDGQELRTYIRGFLRDACNDGSLKELVK